MMIALGFLAPLFVYLVLYAVVPRSRLSSVSLIATALIALISTTTLICSVFLSSHWSKGTQIAWTGIQAKENRLTIGGPQEQATVAWPNGSFAPRFDVKTENAIASIDLIQGRAFLLDENNTALNGEPVNLGESKSFNSGKYTISLQRYYLFWRRIEISNSTNVVLAEFSPPNEEDRAYSLSAFIAKSRREAMPDLSKLAELDGLEDWATSVRILLSSKGQVRILETTNELHTTCHLPCRMSLLWSNNQRLPIKIEDVAGGVALKFLPLWRYSSPIPPVDSKQQAKFVVTSYARPDDVAFLLPLGHGIRDPRELINLSSDQTPVFASPNAIVSGRDTGGGLPSVARPETKIEPDDDGVTSRIAVTTDDVSFFLATVTNGLPRASVFLSLILIALLCLLAGLWLIRPRVPPVNLWVLCGLVAVLWNLLTFRLLLSVRYSLDPASLDRLTIQGVVTAFIGLAVLPGVVIIAARLRCDWFMPRPAQKEQRTAFRYAAAYLLMLSVAFWIEYFGSMHLWAGLPLRFLPDLGLLRGALFVFVFLVLSLYLFGSILFLYSADPSGKNIASLTARIFLRPWAWVENFTKNASGIWTEIVDPPSQTQRLKPFIYLALFWGIFTPLFLFVIFRLFPHLKVIEEFSIPIIFCLPFAIFWLSSRRRFFGGKTVPWKNLKSSRTLAVLICAAVTILPPVLLPFFAVDSGSVLAVLAIFAPMLAILLVAATKYGWTLAVVFFVVLFGVVSLIYPNVEYLSFTLGGKSQTRVLTFREGDAIQKYMLFASVAKGTGLPLQDLQNTYQHTWENKAIAHEGTWGGMGFDEAPTRRSSVRQDTIQFDSVFSFFVASEYGFIGGGALLLLYAIPLILVLVGARRRFDLGYAVACVVAASFLIEALFHAGMNLEAFPFTGRNLPLLSVNSVSDLLRWSILFCLAAQSIFWRYIGKGDLDDDAISVIHCEQSPIGRYLGSRLSSLSRYLGTRLSPFLKRFSFLNRSSGAAGTMELEDRRSYWKAVVIILLLPSLLFLIVGWRAFHVAKDEALGNPFGYEELLSYLQTELIDKNRIVLNPQTLKIEPVSSEITISDEQLISQEIARFNALPDDEKIEGLKRDDYKVIVDDLSLVRSLADYDAVMNRIRQRSLVHQDRHRISLFKIKKDASGNYRLIANPDFNVRLSFKVNAAQTSFRDGKTKLIGPAWIMGHSIATFDPDSSLPWVSELAQVLNAQWSPDRFGPVEGQRHFGTLTLDQKLQNAAMQFMAEKGRQLHAQILDSQTGKDVFDKLPPRVGLSIVSLPEGEVIALGGWPRAIAGSFWRRAENRDWVPPLEWIRRDAPQAFRTRYDGDRNFDIGLVMGSSTKPLWASAALAVHPDLDRQFRVRGTDTDESDVFGINIGGSWGVKPSPGWVDFRTYLRRSDNRYQIRLGFLGLTEQTGSTVQTDSGISNSQKESMDGVHAWRRYPQFFSSIRFSKDHPTAMMNLHSSPLASYLHNMFSIGMSNSDPDYRFSFWTKNENDDFAKTRTEFRSVSPQAANFQFDALPTNPDRIQSPRDYVTRLLGGGTNLWANVDIAGAFATCVTGHPILVHIVKNADPIVLPQSRQGIGVDFPAIAAKLRPGLEDVVLASDGTAHSHLSPQALAIIEEWRRRGVRVYAKTGTLEAQKNARETSRILLVLANWNDPQRGLVRSGLVFSMVAEDAEVGKATEWLGEFLVKNRSDIERFLSQNQ